MENTDSDVAALKAVILELECKNAELTKADQFLGKEKANLRLENAALKSSPNNTILKPVFNTLPNETDAPTKSNDTKATKPHTTFFSLPAELRQQILYHSFDKCSVTYYMSKVKDEYSGEICIINGKWQKLQDCHLTTWLPAYYLWGESLGDKVDGRLYGNGGYVMAKIKKDGEMFAELVEMELALKGPV